MAARTTVKREGYENRTQGYLGAVKVNRKGDAEGVPVDPGTVVYLSDEEVELTEQAHAKPDDSPFKLREIVHFDPDTGDEAARFTAAPLSKVDK